MTGREGERAPGEGAELAAGPSPPMVSQFWKRTCQHSIFTLNIPTYPDRMLSNFPAHSGTVHTAYRQHWKLPRVICRLCTFRLPGFWSTGLPGSRESLTEAWCPQVDEVLPTVPLSNECLRTPTSTACNFIIVATEVTCNYRFIKQHLAQY